MSIIFIIILLQGLKVKGINSLESKKIAELSKKITKDAGTYILKNVNKVNVKNYKTNSDGQKEVVTQIDLDIHKIPQYDNIPPHFHYDIRFLLEAKRNANQIKVSRESHDVAWVHKDKVLNKNNEHSIKRMLNKISQ